MSQYIKKIRTDAGDLQIDYNALANLPALNTMFSSPNLLINSDFRNPINQRGLGTYIGGAEKGYTIDRWCMGNNDFERKVELVSGGVKVTNPNTEYIGTFHQIFETLLPQNTYTATVKVKEILSGGATLHCDGSHGSAQVNLKVGINYLTLDNATISAFVIHLAPNSSIIFEWAKLEVGAQSTSFVPRPYAEEFALCQRYYQAYSGYMVFPQFYENQYYGFYFRTVMRTTPYVVKFIAQSTDGTNTLVGDSVEVYADCVRKLFSNGNIYKGNAIQLNILELDAEIY